MAFDPNSLSRFWQELKRRKVVKAVTMYGATSFILIEASDIILPRLGLPNWTVTFLIILIIVGFVITVVLSWIFDTTPQGIQKTPPADQVDLTQDSGKKVHRKLKVSDVIIVVLLGVVAYLLYPKIFKKDQYEDFRDEQGRITLAVMPFENLTGDSSLNYFQRGISSYLSNDLGNSPQLLVRDEQSMFELTRDLGEVNYAGFNTKNQREIANLLKAETYLTGSFQGRNGNYLILVDLIDSKSGEKIWTDRIKGNLETAEYFDMADSLGMKVRDHLEIKAMKQEVDKDLREAYTGSAEAYRYYMEGVNSMMMMQSEHAVQSLSRALDIDPDFTMAKFYIAWAYGYNKHIDSAAIWTTKAWDSRENLPTFYQDWLGLWHACYLAKKIADVRRSCDLLKHADTDSRLFWFDLGITQFLYLEEFQDAVNSFEKAENISNQRKEPWMYRDFYDYYVQALHKNGEHDKETEVNQLGQRLFPDYTYFAFYDAICAVSRKDWELVRSRESEIHEFWDEREVAPKIREYYIALMFERGGELDSALHHFRSSYDMDPEDPYRHRALARFLIQYDLDLDEAIGLLETIRDTTLRNDYFFKHNMGLALLKEGEPDQALPLLNEAYDLYPNANTQYEKEINDAKAAIRRKQGSK